MRINYALFIILIIIFISGCEKGTTQISTIQPPITEQKIESIPKPECRISEDCALNQYCSNSKCFLVSCPNGEVINHICKQYECLSDIDCRNDEVCEERKCKKLNCKINLVAQNHKCTYQFFIDDRNYINPNDKRTLERLSQLTNEDYSEGKFGKNLKEIYYYVTNIGYKYDEEKWGVPDYWQTSDQTIEDGTGDCEDHAILLQSMIEALLIKTYGYLPNETAYVIVGCVDTNYDGKQDGCHAWNIIDASKLPKDSRTLTIVDTNKVQVPKIMNVVVDDVTINNTMPNPKNVVYEPSKDKGKTNDLFVIVWQGRKWVELESTWGMPLSYYENKGYPFVSIYRAFNSQENYLYPDFIGKDKKQRPIIFQDLIAYLTEFLREVYQYVVNLFE